MHDATKTKNVYFVLPTDEAKIFKARCAEYGVTMSGILRPTVTEFVRTHPTRQIAKKSLVDG